MDLVSRIDDYQISRFTPYGEVKRILDARFCHRMESRYATAHDPDANKPRHRKLDVGGGQASTRLGVVFTDRTEGIEVAGERREEQHRSMRRYSEAVSDNGRGLSLAGVDGAARGWARAQLNCRGRAEDFKATWTTWAGLSKRKV